jgi:hypothetical protein
LGGVVGGVGRVGDDYGCLPIDSKTGAASPSGDVPATDTLAAFAKSVLAGVGVDAETAASDVTGGTILASALA